MKLPTGIRSQRKKGALLKKTIKAGVWLAVELGNVDDGRPPSFFVFVKAHVPYVAAHLSNNLCSKGIMGWEKQNLRPAMGRTRRKTNS